MMPQGQQLNDYQYRTVSEQHHEIRIIMLRPGKFDDSVACDVAHVSLDEAPYYEALSYTWGELTDQVPITLGGSRFWVTRNLALALRHLRPRNRLRPLWVDAVCINQSNTAERNDQVKQMAKIYQRARRVHVWLGLQTEETRLAMGFLKEINAKVLRSIDSQRRLEKVHKEIVNYYYNPEYKAIWEAIAQLWKGAYWSRIWIIQEVVFGTCNRLQCFIHCGNDSIAWETLVALEFAMSAIDQTLLDNEHSDVDVIQESKGARLDLSWFIVTHGSNTRSRKLPLSYLLIRQSRYKATDLRDKVYALLSMVPESQADGLIVDYGLSITEVYTMATKAMVSREKKLGVLCACCRGCRVQRPLDKLPSWCPDWSTDPMDKCCPARLWSYTKQIYSSSGNLDTNARFLLINGRPVLSAPGWCVDTIRVLSHGLPCAMEGFLSLECLLFLAEGIAGETSQALGDISAPVHEDIWRTLVANRGQSHNKAPDDFGKMYRTLLSRYLGPTNTSGPRADDARFDAPDESSIDQTTPFRDKMETCLRKRFLCKSVNKALPGLVPETSKDGDLICILTGCALPIILRRIDDHYLVVGESYIHGFMYGEILDKKEEFESITFQIY